MRGEERKCRLETKPMEQTQYTLTGDRTPMLEKTRVHTNSRQDADAREDMGTH